MRVIAGQFRSRRIKAIPGLDVRPTPDRLREALFSILASRVPGSVFVDAYAGSGAVGIEAISRGAAQVVFLEKNRAALQVIRENLRSLGIASGFEIRPGKAAARLSGITAGIIFLDPPYPREDEYAASLNALAGNTPALVIAQHDRRFVLEESYGALRRGRVLRQGDNSLSFYEPEVS